MDDLPSLASLLITARGSLSIADVARLAKCSRRAIYFYEVDGKLPMLSMLDRIVAAMNPDKELIRRIYAAHKRDAVARNLARAAKRKAR